MRDRLTVGLQILDLRIGVRIPVPQLKFMNTKKVEYHKVVDILIFNNRNELALQMRSANDKSFPSHWDFSVGGHVDKNEEDNKAAEREISEELGIIGKIVFISKEHFQYPDWNHTILREVDASIYKMVHNGPFEINKDEVMKIKSFKLLDIQKIIDAGEKFHPEFLLVWKRGVVLLAINN